MIVTEPKLAIIVPYRDREEHLARFVPHMTEFLSDKNINYKIFIIEQGDDRPFNRGWLLNVGYDIAVKQDFNYFCFHDVDMLPEDNSCDYSWVDKPTHLASKLSKFDYRLIYEEYIGGVTLINKEHFEWVNGFSNKYWGWGFEDDDLLYRLRKGAVPLDTRWVGVGKTKKSRIVDTMEFTGKDYCEIPLSPSIQKVVNNSFSIEAWVKPSKELELNPEKDYDEFHIFSRPGFHTGIAFTSAQQYKGAVWDVQRNQYMVTSEKKGPHWTHVLLTVDSTLKRLRLYVDGRESKNSPSDFSNNLRAANQTSYFIGCANPNANISDIGWFKGHIAQITMWNKVLSPKEVKVCFNDGFPYNVTKQKEYVGWKAGEDHYMSSHNVVGYWDFGNITRNMVVDKSGNDNHAKITGGIFRERELFLGEELKLPNRRDGKFSCLEHEENGWDNTKFKHWESRSNQLRFFNKVRKGLEDSLKDGLSTLEYSVVDKEEFLEKHEFIKIK